MDRMTFSEQQGAVGSCLVAQVWDENGKFLAQIEPTEDDAEATRLARLFAASSDLLEACKATLEEFKHLGQALGEMTPPQMVEVWNKVESAVRKAELQTSM